MWPDRNDALSRTIEAERAIEDLYAEALRRWAPDVRQYVLPALTAATLPPDPAAVQQASSSWDQLAEELVVAGIAVLWAATVFEVLDALGLPLPALPAGAGAYRQPPRKVLQIVDSAVGDMDRAAVIHAARVVEETPALRETRNAFLDTQRQQSAEIPAQVQTKVEAAVQRAEAHISVAPGVTVPEERLEAVRAEVRDTVDPASEQMREIARTAGHQAAAVQNHAVLTAAEQKNTDEDEELDAVWICTIDGKTRPAHFAADGQRTPLGSTFTVGGEQLRFPGDPTGSPGNVYNCRCRVGVLAKDEGLPDEVDRHTERLEGRDSTARNREGSQADEIRRRADDGQIRAREDPEGIGRTAAGGWTAPSEEINTMTGPATTTLAEAETDGELFQTFSGYIGKLGIATSDRRIIGSDADLTMREFPHPMAWQKQASGGHMDSFTVGVVEESKIDGDRVWARGYFLNSEEAQEAVTQVGHKVSAPSLDLAAAEYKFTDEDGNEIEGDLFDWWEKNGEPFTYFTKAEVTGFTLVQTPAFDGIDIELGAMESRDITVVASIVTDLKLAAYDPALFEDPKLTRPTVPTMNNTTGRIYGHLAEWGHPIRGGNGDLAPRNHNDYANFHTSQVLLNNGKQLSVGRLTVKGGHADTSPGVTAATARAHYDNVCTSFGLVRVGEDRFGIWFSGVPAPGVDPDVFQQGMTAPLSGDWRDCGRGLDMIGAHAVNSPGFPIYSAATGPDGREVALVASLGPSRAKGKKTGDGLSLDRESLKTLLTEVVETVDRRRADQEAALAHQTRAEAALARAREVVGDPPAPKTPNEEIAELLARVDA